jgi:glycosyltransferase involved in cell wall biosynthesis
MRERQWFGRFLQKRLRTPLGTARTDVELENWKQVRITIVIGPFYPIPPVLGGAVEKVHLLLAAAYRAAGHNVTIISRRYKDFATDEVLDGIRHIRIRSTDRSSSLAVQVLLDFCYAVRVACALPAADVTITNAFFLPLVLPRRRAGKIYVQVGRYPKGQMWLYSRADRLQAVSRAVGQAIARQVPWLKRKIAVIPYAIPDLYFSKPAGTRRAAVVLYVGRIAREKGIELLIQGFGRLHPHDWRLRIIGPYAVAQGGDGVEYLGQLQALARQLGVGCEFLGPIFDQDALIGEYQRGGVFVYPSLAEAGESLGLAPLEAMATGCAAIVSDLRCFDDYIEDGVTGLRFDHRGADPAAALAVQLGSLIGNPQFQQRVAAAGHGMAENFRTSAIARRMLDDFASLLADPTNGDGVAR